MHFTILVEDQSGKKALEILVPKIIGPGYEFEIIGHTGIGRIPKGLGTEDDIRKRTLLGRLPQMLRACGRKYSGSFPGAVIVVCDLDDRCCKAFLQELLSVLDRCDPKPETRFCIAIEEGEAWLLGDIPAIRKAYPKAKNNIMTKYENDSICGTWETLADAVHKGGARKLKELRAKRRRAVGAEKARWAKGISVHMDVENNKSPSFIHFREKLRELAGGTTD